MQKSNEAEQHPIQVSYLRPLIDFTCGEDGESTVDVVRLDKVLDVVAADLATVSPPVNRLRGEVFPTRQLGVTSDRLQRCVARRVQTCSNVCHTSVN